MLELHVYTVCKAVMWFAAMTYPQNVASLGQFNQKSTAQSLRQVGDDNVIDVQHRK